MMDVTAREASRSSYGVCIVFVGFWESGAALAVDAWDLLYKGVHGDLVLCISSLHCWSQRFPFSSAT